MKTAILMALVLAAVGCGGTETDGDQCGASPMPPCGPVLPVGCTPQPSTPAGAVVLCDHGSDVAPDLCRDICGGSPLSVDDPSVTCFCPLGW